MNDNTDLELEELEGERRRRKGVWLILFLAALAVGATSYYLTALPDDQVASGETKTPVASAPPATAPQPTPAPQPAAPTPAPQPAPAAQSTTAPQPAPAAQAAAPAAATETSASSQQTVSATVSSSVPVAKPEDSQPAKQAEAVAPAPAPVVTAPAEQSATQPAQQTQVASAAVPPAAPAAKPIQPTFDTVRVETTGDALIAGRAAPGTEVTIKLNDAVIGKVTANGEGAFVLVPEKPLPPGSGTLSLQVGTGDAIATSENTVAVVVKEQAKGEALVAVVKPDAPVAVIQAPTTGVQAKSNKVVLDAVEYDDEGSIVFSGRCNPGNTVRIYVDNALVGEVTADANGKWSFNGKSAVAPGKHTLRADEVDKSAKVLSRVELPFLREETAKVAAAEPPAQPAAIGVAADKGNAAVPQRIVIQPGNNLWRLSRVVYGRGKRYTVIYEANKDQIRDPNLIYPGQVFAMPVSP